MRKYRLIVGAQWGVGLVWAVVAFVVVTVLIG
jgi:hypothetical protein